MSPRPRSCAYLIYSNTVLVQTSLHRSSKSACEAHQCLNFSVPGLSRSLRELRLSTNRLKSRREYQEHGLRDVALPKTWHPPWERCLYLMLKTECRAIGSRNAGFLHNAIEYSQFTMLIPHERPQVAENRGSHITLCSGI